MWAQNGYECQQPFAETYGEVKGQGDRSRGSGIRTTEAQRSEVG
jgi:hypothetical protein